MDKYLRTQHLGEDSIVRMCALVNHFVKPVKIVFDVGAATGELTAYFAQQFPFATIFAFEPNKESYQQLKKRNITEYTYHLALSDKKGKTELYYDPKHPNGSSLIDVRPKRQTVETQRLDDMFILANHERIDFMKIDAEGAEPKILEGAQETLKKTDNIYIEISYLKRGIPYIISIFEQLKDFKLMYISEDSNFFFTRLW